MVRLVRGATRRLGYQAPYPFVEANGTYPLPAALNGTYSWIGGGSVCTSGNDQYVCWVDDQRHGRIAKRTFSHGWEPAVDLFTTSPTALEAQFTQDSHNTIVCGVDVQGFVHVAGDHHAVPLNYMRTAQSGDLSTWVAPAMIGTEETQVTYPQFIKAVSGNFYFWYRSGTSGDGDWYLNKWNPGAKTWSRVVRVIQGTTDNNSAYPHPIAVNRTTGRWHLLWTSRTGVDAAGNKNIYAAYSDDEGVTWKKYSNDASYTLPITEATGEVAVSLPGGTPETVLNGGATAVDTNGRPQSVWLVADLGGIYRYRHVYLDAAKAWHYDTLMATTNSSGRVPGLVLWPDGRRWMLFQNGAGGRGNTLRYLDIDTGTETVLLDKNMLHHTPVYEYSHERTALYVLGPYERQDGALGGDPADLGAQLNVPVLAVR